MPKRRRLARYTVRDRPFARHDTVKAGDRQALRQSPLTHDEWPHRDGRSGNAHNKTAAPLRTAVYSLVRLTRSLTDSEHCRTPQLSPIVRQLPLVQESLTEQVLSSLAAGPRHQIGTARAAGSGRFALVGASHWPRLLHDRLRNPVGDLHLQAFRSQSCFLHPDTDELLLLETLASRRSRMSCMVQTPARISK